MSDLTCRIQWIDRNGNPTPDTNQAIGEAYMVPHRITVGGSSWINEDPRRWPICADHMKRFNERGMEYWRFAPYPLHHIA